VLASHTRAWQASSLTQVACIQLRHSPDTIQHVPALLSDSALGNIRPTVVQTQTLEGYRIVHLQTVGLGSSELSAVGEGWCTALGKDDRGGSQRS